MKFSAQLALHCDEIMRFVLGAHSANSLKSRRGVEAFSWQQRGQVHTPPSARLHAATQCSSTTFWPHRNPDDGTTTGRKNMQVFFNAVGPKNLSKYYERATHA